MRSHLFPFRTQKLSSHTPTILGWQRPGKIGSRRDPKSHSNRVALFFLPCLPFYRKNDSGNRGTSICNDKMFRLLLFFVRLIGIISLYKILRRKKFFCYWRGLDNYAAIGHAQTDEQIREQTGRACSVVLRNLNRIAKTHRTGTFPLFGAFLLE